jgi:ABC-2 type transport system ATP-binding protein
MSVTVEVRNVGKAFGDKQILQDISLTLPVGSTFLLLGPNGAGKTTLLRILAGILRPDEGEIRVASDNGRARIGYVPQQIAPPQYMSGLDMLKLSGTLGMLGPERIQERIHYFQDILQLRCLGNMISTYSAGMMKKLLLSMALIPDPHLLILDEVFEGLDLLSRETAIDHIAGLRDKTILIATHNANAYEGLYSHAGILVDGKLKWHGAKDARGLDGKLNLDAHYRSVIDACNPTEARSCQQ